MPPSRRGAPLVGPSGRGSGRGTGRGTGSNRGSRRGSNRGRGKGRGSVASMASAAWLSWAWAWVRARVSGSLRTRVRDALTNRAGYA